MKNWAPRVWLGNAGESVGIPLQLGDLLQNFFSMLDALWCNLVYFFPDFRTVRLTILLLVFSRHTVLSHL